MWDFAAGALYRIAGPPVGGVDLAAATTVWTHAPGVTAAQLLPAVDVDGDGAEDLVLSCSAGATHEIVVLSGTGGGELPCKPSPEGWRSSGAAVADFDGDGVLDLAVGGFVGELAADLPDNEVWIRLGPLSSGSLASADFVLASSDPASSPFGAALAAADIDGDGRAELAIGDPLGGPEAIDGQTTGRVLLVTLAP